MFILNNYTPNKMLQRLMSIDNLPILITSLSAFFTPVKPLVFVVGLFIAVDTIFGIFKAVRLNEEISSDKAARGIGSKFILYTGSVVMVYLLERLIISDIVMAFSTIPFLATRIVSTIFCLIEIKSLDEKFVKIYGYSLIAKGKELLMNLKQTKDDLK